jgi:hypothetical protein
MRSKCSPVGQGCKLQACRPSAVQQLQAAGWLQGIAYKPKQAGQGEAKVEK